MSDEKKITTEKNSYNRRHVDNIKRVIIATFIIMCALPILLCLYLMIRMNNLETKINEIASKLGSRGQEIIEVVDEEEVAQEIMDLEYCASDDLEINTTEQGEYLTLTDDGSAETEAEEEVYEKDTTQNTAGAYQNNGKKVYLTFDDGPSIYTDELLDILKANNVQATFFVVYNDDESLWPMYNRIVDEGHTLAMHSYSHVYETIYSNKEAFVEDVELIHDFLYNLTGVDCTYYRFPGGSSNSVSEVEIEECMSYLNEEGITYYDWNSLSGDAVDTSLSPEQLNENIMSYVRTNQGDSIVLLHDLENNYHTIESLQSLTDTLKEEGYIIAPIDEDTVPVQHVKYETEE